VNLQTEVAMIVHPYAFVIVEKENMAKWLVVITRIAPISGFT